MRQEPKDRHGFYLETLKKSRHNRTMANRNQLTINNNATNMRKKHYLPPKIP